MITKVCNEVSPGYRCRAGLYLTKGIKRHIEVKERRRLKHERVLFEREAREKMKQKKRDELLAASGVKDKYEGWKDLEKAKGKQEEKK